MNMSQKSYSSAGSPPGARPPRSKLGCMTCRRRKVRCNGKKPRCSHCERLNLECKWRQNPVLTPSTTQHHRAPSTSTVSHEKNVSNGIETSSSTLGVSTIPNQQFPFMDRSFHDTFNYASFMWDQNPQEGISQSTRWPDVFSPMDVFEQRPGIDDSRSERNSTFLPNSQELAWDSNQIQQHSPSSGPAGATMEPINSGAESSEEHTLIAYFIRTVVPPIIVQIEAQHKWSSMRQQLVSMSTASAPVLYAILEFSELFMCREQGAISEKYQHYYKRARTELTSQLTEQADVSGRISTIEVEHVLATLFFLSYIDLLEGKIADAHANLKEANDVYQKADKTQLRTVSKRLISWIRLLDARAVSVGGEGLLLWNDDDLMSHASPRSMGQTEAGSPEACKADVEDVIFNVLYQPGFLFFQRIQSFMGRISKIDPWHRSRGTVADETEVMQIAAKISLDLDELWDTRPQLMDFALNGKLTSAHISPSLAFTITRTFRTYYANYHTSKIHLHRVAHKHLPLPAETQHSIGNIRNTARVMTEFGSSSVMEPQMLPVNMLWPLLMWGCEENYPETRGWIIIQINNMEKVATNAKITAQVLQEVQARQDNSKQRVDVRTAMHDIFDSCFAIV